MRVKLTPRFVKDAAADRDSERTVFWDESMPGFGLVVTSAGAKSYVCQYRAKRVSRRFTLRGELTLDQARKKAKAVLGAVANGKDPLADRQKEESAGGSTFKALLEDYLTLECGMKRDANGDASFKGTVRSAPQKLDVFERLVYPRLGKLQIEDLPRSRSKIAKMLDEVAEENGPVMADRTLAHVRRALNWYAARTDEFHSPIVRGMARTKPKQRAGKRVLADDEIRDILTVLAAGAEDIPECFARLQRTLFFAAVRRAEAAHMAGGEIADITRDGFKGSVWTIPGNRMKGKLDHAVPLTAAIRAEIGTRDAAGAGPYVFSTTGGKKPFSGYSKAKKALDRELAALRKREGRPPIAPWTMQRDVRRTARTLMSRAGVPSEVAERVVAHAIPGVEGVYDKWEYLPEKLEALSKLAALIDRIVNPQSNIITLKA